MCHVTSHIASTCKINKPQALQGLLRHNKPPSSCQIVNFVFFRTFFMHKNPLSASGYAPVASESVVALSVRVALRAVSRYQAPCSRAGSALRASWDLVPSECREVPAHCFSDWQLLPYFVDAMLGISVFFSGSCLLCWCGLDALDRGMVYRPLEEGRGGWSGLFMSS